MLLDPDGSPPRARAALRAASFIPIGCMLIAILRRLPGWDPPSLWLDDQWIALAVRQSSLADVVSRKVPAPIGFLAIEHFAARLSNDLEWPLQAAPALFGLLAIPLMYSVLARLIRSPVVRALSCLIAACHPVAELYGVRVKHYSLDLFVVTALLVVMLAALQLRTLARFATLIVASLIGSIFSFASLFVSLCFVHAILFDAWSRRKESRAWRPQLMAAGLFDLVVLALAQRLLVGQSSTEMRWFWRSYFLHFDSVQGVLLWIARRFLLFPVHALSLPLIVLAPLLFVGAKVLLRDETLRPLIGSFFLLIGGLVVAAALDIYPMGAERVELFSYPLFWTVAAVGGDVLWQTRGQGRLARVIAAYVLLVCLARPPVRYSDVRDRQVVEQTLRRWKPGDALLMQHTGLLAFAYYSGRRLTFEHYSDVCHQFIAWPAISDLHVLPIETNGRRLVEHPDASDLQLARLYEHGYARIFYVSTHATDGVDRHIVEDAARYGYQSQRIDESPRARLFILERSARASLPEPPAR